MASVHDGIHASGPVKAPTIRGSACLATISYPQTPSPTLFAIQPVRPLGQRFYQVATRRAHLFRPATTIAACRWLSKKVAAAPRVKIILFFRLRRTLSSPTHCRGLHANGYPTPTSACLATLLRALSPTFHWNVQRVFRRDGTRIHFGNPVIAAVQLELCSNKKPQWPFVAF